MQIVLGNLLDAEETFIIHGCNAQGVMSAGVAKAIRAKWPNVYEEYRNQYEEDGLILGNAYVSETDDGIFVGNLITQENFGTEKRQVSYSAIVRSIYDFINYIRFENIIDHDDVLNIATPAIKNGTK